MTFLLRRGWAELRNEVLVLPSRCVALAWAIAVLLLPVLWPDPYVLRVAAMTCLFATLAASWDLLAGFAGQMSFGHALFFGAGAYASALASLHLGLSPWITIWIGAAVATAVGVASGFLCLRLRGAYLSLATLAFPLIALGILFAFPDVSGGELGISGLRPLARSRAASYYVTAVATLVLVFGTWLFADSRHGLLLHAIRDDEVAARASGIDTVRTKLAVFGISAFTAGLAGGLYAHFMRVAGPSTLETTLSFQVVIWGIFGGLATIYGPVAAVCVLYPLTEWLGTYEAFSQLRLLVFAVVVLVVLLFMPRGLTPWIRDRLETKCPRCKQRNVAWRSGCRLCGAELHATSAPRAASAAEPARAAERPEPGYSPR